MLIELSIPSRSTGQNGLTIHQEPTQDPGLPSNADEWLEDLALMHHYNLNLGDMGLMSQHPRVHEL